MSPDIISHRGEVECVSDHELQCDSCMINGHRNVSGARLYMQSVSGAALCFA